MTIAVDMSHLFYRAVFANRAAVIDNPKISAHLILNSLYYVIDKFNVHTAERMAQQNHLVAAFDCHRKDNWRTKFYDENSGQFEDYFKMSYKGQRVQDAAMPWEEMLGILDDVRDFLRDYTDITVIHHENAEADDVIYVETDSHPFDVTIISSDKDFKQLLSDRVKVYDPIKRKYMTFDEDEAKVFLTEHILMGDKSDNILPIRRGIGPKTARKWAWDPDVFMYGDKELKKRFQFNKVLIDLKELPSWIYDEILNDLGVPQKNWNLNEVVKFFAKYKLRKLGERIDVLKLKGANETDTGNGLAGFWQDDPRKSA